MSKSWWIITWSIDTEHTERFSQAKENIDNSWEKVWNREAILALMKNTHWESEHCPVCYRMCFYALELNKLPKKRKKRKKERKT